MINHLTGTLIQKNPPRIVIDVNGVGYECFAPMETCYQLPDIGQTLTVQTVLIVREDSQTLYAFHNEQTKSLFQLLIKVSGIGPKAALAILSAMNPELFASCIAQKNHQALTKIPGIGAKTAQRLVLELDNKLGASEVCIVSANVSASMQDAAIALQSLGYKDAEITRMLKNADSAQSADELIRFALAKTL